jgi:type VII secretion protein EccB
MATRKDQLDAFVFARRRMVANLVAPSPSGSDEAAPRPVKTFFTSAVLSVIVVAGVAVLGVFKPSAPSGWQTGLAVDSSSGAAYVYSPQDKTLHPMLNITSARLLLGDTFKKFDVPDKVINAQTIGAPFGIPDAPPDVPSPSSVDLRQWTLCVQSKSAADQTVSGGKTYLGIGYGAGQLSVATPNTAFFVHDDTNNYMVTGDYAYRIDDNLVMIPLANASVQAGAPVGPWVSSAWLKAFQRGTDLKLPTVKNIGHQLPQFLTRQPGERIGDYGTVLGANGQQVDYIETSDGLVEVNPFIYTLYIAQAGLDTKGVSRMSSLSQSDVTTAQPRDERKNPDSLVDAGSDWPQKVVTPIDSDGVSPGFGVFCVDFSGTFDGRVPRLAIYYGTDLPYAGKQGAGVLQSGGSSYANTVLVAPGHAALAYDVSSGNSQNEGPEYLVTASGAHARYRMVTNATIIEPDGKSRVTSAAKMLRYDGLKIWSVPDNWMSLIQAGADLDPAAAGTTPPLTD